MYYFVYVWENILSQRYQSVYCRCVNVQNMGLLLTHTLMCVYNSAANVYVVYVWKSLTSRRYSSVNCQCVYELWYMHNAEILFCQLSMCQCTYYGSHTNDTHQQTCQCLCVYELWYMHNAEILLCQLSMSINILIKQIPQICQCVYAWENITSSVICRCVNVQNMGPIPTHTYNSSANVWVVYIYCTYTCRALSV